MHALLFSDNVFIVDTSGGSNDTNLYYIKNFIKNVLADADTRDCQYRVGIVTYDNAPVIALDFDAYSLKSDLYEAIDDIHYTGGNGTQTHLALQTAQTQFFSRNFTFNSTLIDKNVILISHSECHSNETCQEAEKAKSQGIKITAIGISLQNTDVLDCTASEPLNRYKFSIDTFTQLSDISEKVSTAHCKSNFVLVLSWWIKSIKYFSFKPRWP